MKKEEGSTVFSGTGLKTGIPSPQTKGLN